MKLYTVEADKQDMTESYPKIVVIDVQITITVVNYCIAHKEI